MLLVAFVCNLKRCGCDDLAQLFQALSERSGSGLQDVCRLDFIDSVVTHRGHLLPAWPVSDRRGIQQSPAPGCNYDLWVAPGDDVRFHDAVPGEPMLAKLRKNRLTSGDLDELFNPTNSRDQGLHPLLEVDCRPALVLAGRSLGGLESGSQVSHQGFSFLRTAYEGARHQYSLKDLRYSALIEDYDRDSSFDQFSSNISLQVREANDQIRFQRAYLVVFRGGECRNPWLGASLGGPHCVS